MPASIQNPADLINLALRRIGYDRRVGSLLDGSKAASASLDIYAQTRDDLLRDGEWQFCERNINAALLKSAPPGGYFDAPWDPATNPPWPWLYSYTWPSDCLKVRILKPQPGFMVNMDPQPTLYSVLNDTGYDTPRRVIVANVPSAILTYAGQITDPKDMPADFIEALASEIGLRLKKVLMGGEVGQAELMDVQRSVGSASSEQG